MSSDLFTGNSMTSRVTGIDINPVEEDFMETDSLQETIKTNAVFADEPPIQKEPGQKITDTIKISSSVLRTAVRALSGIAGNAMNDSDKLINFMCYDDTLILTSTDTSREAQITLQVQSNVRVVFSTSVSKLLVILTDVGFTEIEIKVGHLLVKKEQNQIQLPRYKVNHKPFETNFSDDTIPVDSFLKVLKIFSKYLTSEPDSSGVIIFSDNNVYVRNRLFYVMADFPLKQHYLFDKTTCKNIITMLSAFSSPEHKHLRIAKLDNDSSIMMILSNMAIKVPMLRHDKIDLTEFKKLNNVNGFMVQKTKLLRIIKEIKEVDGTSELDIIGQNSLITIKPNSDLSLTEYKLKADEMIVMENQTIGFTHTVNLDAFETLLRGVNTEELLLSSSKENALLILNRDIELLIRFFISVY